MRYDTSLKLASIGLSILVQSIRVRCDILYEDPLISSPGPNCILINLLKLLYNSFQSHCVCFGLLNINLTLTISCIVRVY